MPARKKRPSGPVVPDDSTAWRVILDDIKSQNRTTLEALHTSHHRLKDGFQELKEQSDARFDLVMAALRDVRADLKADIARLDAKVVRVEAQVAGVDAKVDKLIPLEERLVALERRGA